MTSSVTQVESPFHEQQRSDHLANADLLLESSRWVRITDVPVVRGMIDLTMVALIGGGPRLALRAAKVMLAEEYSSAHETGDKWWTRRARPS
jgi:hypothetical protein